MDIKRGILWFVFVLSILLIWSKWNEYNGRPALFSPAPQVASAPAASGNPAMPTAAQVSAAAAANPAAVTAPGETPVKSEDIVITTDVFKATFDTAGGELKRLELLQYQETKSETLWDVVVGKFRHTEDNAPPKNVVIFDDAVDHKYLAQTGLTDANFPGMSSGYVARPGPRSLDAGDTLQLVFDSEKGGVKLTKTFTFKRGQYAIDVKHDVTNNTAAAIAPTLDLRLVRDGKQPPTPRFAPTPYTGTAMSSETAHFEKMPFEKIGKGTDEHVKKANDGWIAMIQHFFVSTFIPPQNVTREIYTKALPGDMFAIGATMQYPSIAPGASASIDTTLYSGPQEGAALEKVAPNLELTRDYGMFAIVAKPIFWVMDQIHKVLGNWGWTIIAFTVLMKIVFFPLSASSFRSMAKTKLLAPKMTAIRERHKADPQKMNQAMMELYKTEKVNPIGGCLPVLVQMPVFIALYSVLQASVETRNAPWVGWIHDLSTPDPLSILPLLMAVSMFIQTKLNPAPPDPVQAKVMMFMPLIFSVMFFMFPSGVVLYYVVNNVLSIVQQWLITKKLSAPAVKA